MRKKFIPWDYCLRQIYEAPASVSVISGDWKTGKTDFVLYLTVEELKERLHIISKVAGNVRCFQDPECLTPSEQDVKYIDNFQSQEAWLKTPGVKAFIYDEAIKHTPSKRAMTALNAYWLRIVPELSKGGGGPRSGSRCHLFVLTQEESLTEKLFLNPTFRTAKWVKRWLRKSDPQFRKVVRLTSKVLRRKLTFKDLPSTRVHFNPYLSASWSMAPTETSFIHLSLDMKVAIDYFNGLNYCAIVKKYPEINHRTEAMRLVNRAGKQLINMLHVTGDMRRDKADNKV